MNSRGSYTELDDPGNLATIAKYHKWIAFQVQNCNAGHDVDLDIARRHGLRADVWGVSYSKEDCGISIYDQNVILGQQAVKLGASQVHVNIEHAAKGTRATQGLKVCVNALRAAGYTGPVHLNTMGAPDSPETSDYEIDVKSFLDTGGSVFSQDYYNESDSFSPLLGMKYWVGRMKVPFTRFNSMIGLHTSASDKRKPNLRLPGRVWAGLLAEAGIVYNMSIFRTQDCWEEDLQALAIAVPTTPTNPTQITTLATCLKACEDLFRYWVDVKGYEWDAINKAASQGTPINRTKPYKIANIIAPDKYPLPT